MKFLYSRFTAKDGKAEEVAEALAGFAELVRAEPGNVAFDPYRLDDNGNKFFVWEAYKDEDAFKVHIEADYQYPFNTKLAQLIEEPASDLTFLHAM